MTNRSAATKQMVPDPADERDVTFAFLAACPIPSPADVRTWGERYPAHAAAIANYAALALQFAFSGDIMADDPEEAAQAVANEPSPIADLPTLVKEANATIAGLSRSLDIDRGLLADLVAGRIRLPLPRKLPLAMAASLGVAVDRVTAALARSFEQPRLGFANASESPSAPVTSFSEAVSASAMTDERKAFWLSED